MDTDVKKLTSIRTFTLWASAGLNITLLLSEVHFSFRDELFFSGPLRYGAGTLLSPLQEVGERKKNQKV
jgi:hypothetical protein